MAREFTKNLANYISLGIEGMKASVGGKAALSIHCLCYIRSVSAEVNGNPLIHILIDDPGTVGFSLNIDAGTTAGSNFVRLNGRSSAADARQGRSGTTNLPLNTWIAIGGVMHYFNDTISPVYEGDIQNAGAATFGQTSLTYGPTPHHPDGLGVYAPGTTAQVVGSMFDGYIAEMGIWGGDIGLAAFEELAARRVPYKVRPDLLTNYWPLDGRQGTTEQDYISRVTGSISGSIPIVRHPRVFR